MADLTALGRVSAVLGRESGSAWPRWLAVVTARRLGGSSAGGLGDTGRRGVGAVAGVASSIDLLLYGCTLDPGRGVLWTTLPMGDDASSYKTSLVGLDTASGAVRGLINLTLNLAAVLSTLLGLNGCQMWLRHHHPRPAWLHHPGCRTGNSSLAQDTGPAC